MRAVLQRVTQARCTVAGQVTGETGPGLLVLLGVAPGDTEQTAQVMAAKIARLRIFGDEAGKMNRSVQDMGGGILSISQFTLYADTRSGNRPSFTGAAPPEQARALYAVFNAALRDLGLPVGEGVFGAHMVIDLTNDGPVTLTLDVA
ncbi:D-aminoacyl-tRNA deacylase [Deinococcus multiflagellatus]|uniref:D-aminoacyl-tRNA deacylase n=1 Tax=Deinococcus multiflagellatus TaxID=1656887 RepID=A0ABW1ZIA5_9DEIO|nr:D-aminoacyl-tRNA deacylase [Deinococcus multiflagellatus]MBZ9712105.1 D-tyrosyl-tRNA(Tyr) deacylase [Deinococcus multiflagellatus]